MPIYEYRCSSCGHELEALQKFSDAPLAICPSCHAGALVKLVSAGGFQLKGSGWYATDFKSSGAKPAPVKSAGAAKSETGAGSDGAATGDAKGGAPVAPKSDAKSDAKSETAGSAKPPAATTGAPPATT